MRRFDTFYTGVAAMFAFDSAAHYAVAWMMGESRWLEAHPYPAFAGWRLALCVFDVLAVVLFVRGLWKERPL